MTGRAIVVYAGRGASLAEITAESLRGEANEQVSPVQLADMHDIRDGKILKDAALLVMPGGADRPYCEDLNGEGTANIRAFALRRSFLAWCAGGYFAARRIEFHKGLDDEVVSPRELGLFPGTAVGSQIEFGVPYNNRITSVSTPTVELACGRRLAMYYHGGAAFRADPGYAFDAADGRLTALGRFADLPGKPVCIARTNHPEGGRSILSGVHFELPSDLIAGQLRTPRNRDYAHIGAVLQETEQQRRHLLRSILSECGVSLNRDQPRNVMDRLARFLPRPVFEDMSTAPA